MRRFSFKKTYCWIESYCKCWDLLKPTLMWSIICVKCIFKWLASTHNASKICWILEEFCGIVILYIGNMQWTLCGIEMAGHHKISQICWYHLLKKESSLHLITEKRLEKVTNWDVLNHLGTFDEKILKMIKKKPWNKIEWNFMWHKLCCIVIYYQIIEKMKW